jgi:hypothetical protein
MMVFNINLNELDLHMATSTNMAFTVLRMHVLFMEIIDGRKYAWKISNHIIQRNEK